MTKCEDCGVRYVDHLPDPGSDGDAGPSIRTTRVVSTDPRLNIYRGAAQRGFTDGAYPEGYRTFPWPDGGYITFMDDEGTALWVGHHTHWIDAAAAVKEATR